MRGWVKDHPVHLWATIFWCILVIPTLGLWQASLTWVVFMSIYAIITSHWTSHKSELLDKQMLEILQRLDSQDKAIMEILSKLGEIKEVVEPD